MHYPRVSAPPQVFLAFSESRGPLDAYSSHASLDTAWWLRYAPSSICVQLSANPGRRAAPSSIYILRTQDASVALPPRRRRAVPLNFNYIFGGPADRPTPFAFIGARAGRDFIRFSRTPTRRRREAPLPGLFLHLWRSYHTTRLLARSTALNLYSIHEPPVSPKTRPSNLHASPARSPALGPFIAFSDFPQSSGRVLDKLQIALRPRKLPVTRATRIKRIRHANYYLHFWRSRPRCDAYLNASVLLHQCVPELPANAFDVSNLRPLIVYFAFTRHQIQRSPKPQYLNIGFRVPASNFALRHAITAPPTFKFWISRAREVAFAFPAHVNFGFGLPASAVTTPSTRRAAWGSLRAKLAFTLPPPGQQRAINTLDLQSPQAMVHPQSLENRAVSMPRESRALSPAAPSTSMPHIRTRPRIRGRGACAASGMARSHIACGLHERAPCRYNGSGRFSWLESRSRRLHATAASITRVPSASRPERCARGGVLPGVDGAGGAGSCGVAIVVVVAAFEKRWETTEREARGAGGETVNEERRCAGPRHRGVVHIDITGLVRRSLPNLPRAKSRTRTLLDLDPHAIPCAHLFTPQAHPVRSQAYLLSCAGASGPPTALTFQCRLASPSAQRGAGLSSE
ncbi:hypothetical protein DFH09DRAFT_1371537 [Mycena vulgaris]|nr:hypothetical protein DFH09DRAFT_1371537 [Mycena vulgaris]